MKTNFQKTSLIFSAVIFLLLCFAFMFLYTKINNYENKTEVAKVAWQAGMNNRNELASLNQSVKETADGRALLDTHFTQSSDVVPFLNTIENLAPLVGAKATIDSVDSGANNNQLIINLSASGSFESIYKLLNLLENSPYELDFISMDMHSLSDTTSPSATSKDLGWEAVFQIQLLTFIPSN